MLVRFTMCAALASSGCFALAVGRTHHELLTSSVIDTRVTKQPADIDSTLCYVDRKVATTERKRISSWFRFSSLGEVTVGLIASLLGAPAYYVGLPVLVDGLMTIIYVKGQDDKMINRSHWEETIEAAPCK
jgi:hypothetical protein